MEKKKEIPSRQDSINFLLFKEEKFSIFSKAIFKNKLFGIMSGFYLNFIYIHNWKKNKNIFSLLLLIYINILIILIILKIIFKINIEEEEENNNNEINEIIIKKRKEYFRKIISLEEPSSTIRSLIYANVCLIVASILGDKFIIFIFVNIFVFYYPINTKFPNFLFMSLMSVKQTIEGVIGIIECLIPRYVEEKLKIN